MTKDRRILDFHLFEKFLKLAKFTGMKADIQILEKEKSIPDREVWVFHSHLLILK